METHWSGVMLHHNWNATGVICDVSGGELETLVSFKPLLEVLSFSVHFLGWNRLHLIDIKELVGRII
jgi:hypothetical protein